MTCVLVKPKAGATVRVGCRQSDRVGTASSNRPKIEIEVAERLCQERRRDEKGGHVERALLSGLLKSAPEQSAAT
jgi:hypothetical protein